jgi:hypothetical protein
LLNIHAPDHAPADFRGEADEKKNGNASDLSRKLGNGKHAGSNMEERLLSLLSLLATLEECRDFLMDKASPETARLLSLAILELRMELHQVTDSELEAEDRKPQESNSARPLPPYLKLIK